MAVIKQAYHSVAISCVANSETLSLRDYKTLTLRDSLLFSADSKMPGAPSSVLAPSSEARKPPVASLLLVAIKRAPSSVLLL